MAWFKILKIARSHFSVVVNAIIDSKVVIWTNLTVVYYESLGVGWPTNGGQSPLVN